MVAPYDLNKFDNISSIYEITKAVNDITSPANLFMNTVLMTFFIILIMILKGKGFDTRVTLLTSAFVVSVVGVIFWSIDLISWTVLTYPTVLALIAIFYKIFGDSQ